MQVGASSVGRPHTCGHEDTSETLQRFADPGVLGEGLCHGIVPEPTEDVLNTRHNKGQRATGCENTVDFLSSKLSPGT